MIKKQLRFSLLFFLIFITFTNYLYSQNFTIFFGDLHQHSTLSFDALSGALEPGAAFNYAKNTANLDFLAITDHANNLNNGQPVEGWQMLLNAAETGTGSEFVALGSQEVGLVFQFGGYGHVIIHNSPHLADNDVYPDVRFNLNDMFNFIITRNSLAHFCHPGINGDASNKFNGFTYNPQADPFFYGLEVLSGKRSTNYEKFYLLALEKGWHVGAVSGQDNHSRNYGNRIEGNGNINLTAVLLDTLNRNKLLDAFKNHRTYAFQTSPASDRIFLTEFTADDRWMGEVFDNDDNNVDFKVAAHAQGKFISAHLYKNGHLFKRFEPNSNDFNWAPADSVSFGTVYYFIKLVQEDMDVLWSSPIWINSSGDYQPPQNLITSISDLKENFSSGLPRNIEATNITIRGVATVGSEFGTDGPGFLQDSTGGIAVFGASFVEKVIPGFALEFEVTGKVSFYNGQTEFIPHAVTRLGLKEFPQIARITTGEIASNGEVYEGSLVQIVGATISGNFPSAGSNANIAVDDGSGACTLRIDKDTNIPGSSSPTGKVTITGVIGQYKTTPPYTSGYQLLPRSTADIEVITSIEDTRSSQMPEKFTLSQNYPNPFNAGTQIIYTVPNVSQISFKIYNIAGQKIRTLLDKESPPGEYKITWNGLDDKGREVASGVFFYQLTTPDLKIVKKLILLQ